MKTVIWSILVFLFSIWLYQINKLYIGDNDKIDINLIGLNSHDDEDLYIASKVIKDYFGFNCFINGDVKTKYQGDIEPFLFKSNLYSFDCSKIQRELGHFPMFFFNIFGDINIYITKDELYIDDVNINGITYGNEIYVNSENKLKKVVIHELLHNYGMEHCYDHHCLMSNNPNRVGWDVKKDKPNFCLRCKKELPPYIKKKI